MGGKRWKVQYTIKFQVINPDGIVIRDQGTKVELASDDEAKKSPTVLIALGNSLYLTGY